MFSFKSFIDDLKGRVTGKADEEGESIKRDRLSTYTKCLQQLELNLVETGSQEPCWDLPQGKQEVGAWAAP